MSTILLRDPIIIKKISNILKINHCLYLIIIKINDIKRTSYCITDLKTKEKLNIDYNLIKSLL